LKHHNDQPQEQIVIRQNAQMQTEPGGEPRIMGTQTDGPITNLGGPE